MMNDFLREMKNEFNMTTTENGAVAYQSTMNACLDAFGSLGAMRFSDEEDIIRTYSNAYIEDRELALKLLFYMRDIRGGQGQRRVFRTILKWLANNCPNDVINNLDNILFFGRGDDYLCLFGTDVEFPVLKKIKEILRKDVEAMLAGKECSLLAKWLPSENASSAETKKYAKRIISSLGISPREYRKTLSELRKYIDVTEVKMSANKWDKINYNTVPAKAAMNYSDAFLRHDMDNYVDYLQHLSVGRAKINSASLFPVDIVHKVYEKGNYCNVKDRVVLDAMWKALPNYLEGKEETGICVVDTSGSMRGLPLEVAVSLGMYCADKCHGPFKNHFITFSSRPQLVELKGNDIVDKVHNIKCIVEDTNIEAVFDLILRTAINNGCKQEDIPSKLYIISDMQFNEAQGYGGWGWYGYNSSKPKPFMKIMRKKFEDAGYKMPTLIYWNVRASKCGMFHEMYDGENIAMVSGYSASLFKSIIEGTTYEETVDEKGNVSVKEKVDPVTVMLTTLNSDRYSRVVC